MDILAHVLKRPRMRQCVIGLAVACLWSMGMIGQSLPAFAEPDLAEQAVPGEIPFVLEITPPSEEIQTRGLETASACGTYQLRSKADKAAMHLNGLGDKLVSTRWQPNDDYVRFILELQPDGSVRIRNKATGQYLYEEAGDKLVSTRQAINDPRANVWLEPAVNGSVRIKSAATGRYWHYNGLGDKLISTRWQTADPFSSFTLERVTGPTAVAACTTDVVEQVLAKEFNRAVFDRQAKLVALLQASDAYLASNPLIRSLPQGAPIVNLNAAVRNYLAKYPQGSRKVKIAELQAIAAQIQALKANAIALSTALTPTSESNATVMANAQSGLAAVQTAIENLAASQRSIRQWGQARLRNLTTSIRAAKGVNPAPVVAVFGKGGATVPQIQTRAIGDPASTTIGTEFVAVPAQSAVVEQGSTIVVVTESPSGFNVSSVVGAAQQYQQALQSGQVSGHPTGNQLAPVVITSAPSDTIDLFEYASMTGAFDQLTIPAAADTCSSQSTSKADAMWDMSAGEGCVKPEPELKSYSRGAGKPLSCASGQVQSGALCYEPCQSGYKLVAGVCWQNCPSGYRDDGAFCAKPGNYQRKKYPWKFGDKAFSLDDAKKRCQAANPTVGCEKQGQIYYSNCSSGYKELLLDWCTPKCPSDMGTDIGVSCTKKTYSNPTPWGKPLSSCASGMEKEGQLCYTTCKSGYQGALTQCLPN